jgi:hypothetical protein
MFRVKVDASGVHALTREAHRTLNSAPDRMQRLLVGKAAEERRTHAYRNRTGDLEASTQASNVVEIGDQFLVQLEAAEEYASYVDNRGLMRIHELAQEAETEIDYMFDGDAERLGSL